jgi:hypothetical protein
VTICISVQVADGLIMEHEYKPNQCIRQLASQAFIERDHVQLIHHPRTHLHQSMPMPEQLPQVSEQTGLGEYVEQILPPSTRFPPDLGARRRE